MEKKTKISRWTKVICVMFALITGLTPMIAFANSEFSVSPMSQKIVLNPGEQYSGTFDIVNPSSNDHDFSYQLTVEPYFVDEAGNAVFENNGDYNQIVNWITLKNDKGTIRPNSTASVEFDIAVPQNAPAGGRLCFTWLHHMIYCIYIVQIHGTYI